MVFGRKKKEEAVKAPMPESKIEAVSIGKVEATTPVQEQTLEEVLKPMVDKMTDNEFKVEVLALLIEIRDGLNGGA